MDFKENELENWKEVLDGEIQIKNVHDQLKKRYPVNAADWAKRSLSFLM